MSHGAHAGGHGGPTDKYIGITMACLGVLLAFCSALVGGQRTALVKTMVEQTTAQAKYQAQSIKYRMVVSQLQAMVGTTANPAEKGTVLKFAGLVRKYRAERDAASEWIDSFDVVIDAHAEASERYEWSQLCAEIGIVIASIALLFGSRKIWGVSLVLSVAAVGLLTWTAIASHAVLAPADQRIAETGRIYKQLRKDQDERAADEELVKRVQSLYGEITPTDGK